MKKAILILLLLISFIPVGCYAMSVEEAEEIVGINISTANASTLKEYITQLDIGLSLSIDEAGVRALFDMKDAASERLIAMGEGKWLFAHVMETNFDLENLTKVELVVMRNYLNDLIEEKVKAESSANSTKDLSSMPAEDAMALIGEEASNSDCTYRSCELWENGYYLIHVNLDTPFTFESGLSNAIRYTIDFGRLAFALDGIHTLRFEFHQETRDKYGNASEGSPIIWKLKESTFNRMDIDFFYTHTYSDAKRFINACDSAAVAASYKNVAK